MHTERSTASQKPWRCYKLAQSLGLLLPTIISNYPLTRLSNYSSDNKRSQSGARVAIAVQARYNLLQLPCNLAHIFGRPSYDFAIHLLVFASPDSTGESRNWFCTAPRRSSNLASLQASSRVVDLKSTRSKCDEVVLYTALVLQYVYTRLRVYSYPTRVDVRELEIASTLCYIGFDFDLDDI